MGGKRLSIPERLEIKNKDGHTWYISEENISLSSTVQKSRKKGHLLRLRDRDIG